MWFFIFCLQFGPAKCLLMQIKFQTKCCLLHKCSRLLTEFHQFGPAVGCQADHVGSIPCCSSPFFSKVVVCEHRFVTLWTPSCALWTLSCDLLTLCCDFVNTFLWLCERYLVLCEHYIVLCEHCLVLCEHSLVLCEHCLVTLWTPSCDFAPHN